MRHHPTAPAHAGARLSAVVMTCALACVQLACSREGDQQGSTTPAPAATPATRIAGEQSPQDLAELRTLADRAMQEQRLYAPAGSNAMEYYLTLRDKVPSDASVSSVLTDLMPYALIAAEQDIASGNRAEAQRLFALMQRVDPDAPALPRLRDAIAQMSSAPTPADTDSRSAAQESEQAAPAPPAQPAPRPATDVAAQPADSAPAATTPATGTAPASSPAAAVPLPARSVAETPAPQTERQPAATAPDSRAEPAAAKPPAAPITPALRALRTPAPVYPQDALNDGISGEVVVEFTVSPDGDVTNATIISANPPRVFNRATLNAVRRWRFAPVAEPVTTRRTVGFKSDR